MTTESQVKGPASGFPAIEKTYGKPVTHCLQTLQTLQAVKGKKQVEQVAFLKDQHAIGHGHADARVAFYRAQPAT